LQQFGVEALPPRYASGKICYLEIPALDIEESATFYEAVFGWSIRRRGAGEIAFDDTVGEVSGTWVTGRPPSSEPGITVHVMVDDIYAAVARVLERGGELVTPVTPLGEREGYATFRDPAGNVLGIYQEATLAS
jgi:predicted enzyme related to lactoylglutathione lyase